MANKLLKDNPLTPSDYADIQRALERLNTHRIRAEDAKRAGENVDDDIALNEALRERFAAYKRVYFPNKP
jgi:hypothetical protein